MNKSVRLLITLILTISPVLHFPASADNEAHLRTILILGDSISAGYGIAFNKGWVHLLQDRVDNNYRDNTYQYKVINASISGNTTGDGVNRLAPLLNQHKPTIVIVELGGNDGLRGYPIKLMQRNLQTIIDKSKGSGAIVLLAGIEIPPNYGKRYTDSFRSVFKKVAHKNNVAFLPFILDKVATEPSLMQADGIHPTEEAQAILLDNVWQYLKPLL